MMWKTIEVSKKLIPLVPRSIALVSPPVCRERWKLRSSFNKCSKTLRATRRIAFWATLAKTAFLNSWKITAPILVAPSVGEGQMAQQYRGKKLTGKDHGAGDRHCSAASGCKVYVHGIYNALEVERNLYIEDLLYNQHY